LIQAAEVVADVRVVDVSPPGVDCFPDGLQRLQRADARPEAEGRGQEVRLEDRIQHQLRRHLDDAILDRGDPQRPQLSVGFGDVPPQHGRCSVLACLERALKLIQQPLDAVLLHRRKRDSIHASSTLVRADPLPRLFQHVTPVDAVVKRVETPSPMLLGCNVELLLESSDFVRRPSPPGVIGSARADHALALTSR